jgi:carbamoylphosphate synthase small subunit
MKIIISLIFTAFITQISFAELYKCIKNNGSTAYQATPCKVSSLETKLQVSNKLTTKLSQCESSCDSQKSICVTKLDNGSWNDDGGFDLCSKEQEICKISCIDTREARRLKIRSDYKRTSYEIDKKFEKREKKRNRERKFKEQKECSSAKSVNVKAVEAWDRVGRKQRERLSRIEKAYYLNKITDSERDLKYKCK